MPSLRLVLIAALSTSAAIGCADTTDERPATFEYIVTTVLKPSCGTATCHSSMTRTEDLAFDTVAAASEAFDSRPLAPQPLPGDPGEPGQSELLFYLTTTGDKRMPVDSPMPEADIALIERWIIDGAVRP